MKATRLARLVGDMEYLEIFQYEVSGYPSTPHGIPAATFELTRQAGRVSQKKKSKDSKELTESSYVSPIEQIEAEIEITKARLGFCRPQALNLSSANSNQWVSPPTRNLVLERTLTDLLLKWTERLASRRSFVYRYCLDQYIKLNVSSAAEQVFDDYRRIVDENLGSAVPGELKRLDSIGANLGSENPEDWANALHSCRRLLQALADSIYPPKAGETVQVGKKTVKIGPENYINRLVLSCEENSHSAVYQEVVGSSIHFLGDRLDGIFAANQKGSHSDVTLEEARRSVLYTYMTVGDILRLARSTDAVPPKEAAAFVEEKYNSPDSEGEKIN